MLRSFFGFFIAIVLLLNCDFCKADTQEDMQEAFYKALAEGKKQEVSKFLDKGFGIENENGEGRTPLMLAAQHGYKDIVELLLSRKAKITARDINGSTPLMFAVKGGSAEVVRLLLARHNGANEADYGGWTPLMEAAFHGHIEVMRLLITSGANINAQDKQGESALFKGRNNSAVMELLLAHGADSDARDINGNTLLLRAVQNQHVTYDANKEKILEAIRYLAKLTKNKEARNKDGNTALITAHGSRELLELLIDAGADVNARNFRGETALMLAASGNYYKEVEVLLSHGARIEQADNAGHTALWHAGHCAIDCSAMEKLLRARGATEKAEIKGATEFACGEITANLTLDLPGQNPVRQLVFLTNGFSSLQVLLKSSGLCRVVLEDRVETNDLKDRMSLQKGDSPEFPDVVLKSRRYSAKGTEEYSVLYAWSGTSYQRKGTKKAVELNRTGLALVNSGKLTEAIAGFAKAHELDPNNVEVVNNLGFAHYQKGLKTKNRESFQTAERYFEEAIYRDRKRWQAYVNLADLYRQTGRMDQALDNYEKAAELNPSKASAAKIRKKIQQLHKGSDNLKALAVVREKVNANLPAYLFKLLGDPVRRVVKRVAIADATTGKNIQDLDVEKDYDEMESPPDDDYFSLEDINFDGYKDICLLVGWGATGNRSNSYWLFDARSKKFVFSKDFEGLGTVTLDPEKKQINTHSNGGHAGMIYSDATYEVRNNKPVLIREVDQDYDDTKGYYIETTREMINGSKKESIRIVPGQ